MITPGYGITSTERVLPRLALDFTTASLDPRVTVTRALNTATRINSSGALEIVNANLPRFDFDPSTLLCRGLLIEEGRINIILQSNDFSQAAWSKLNGGAGTAPVVTSGQTDPWGGSTAWRLQANSGGSGGSDYSILRQTITTNNSPRSLWIKSNTGVNQSIYVGAVVSTSVVTATSTWTRVTPKPASNSPYFDIGTFPNGSSNTTQNIDILIYGAQCETDLGGAATTFSTSYIPTTTTSLTRNADVVNMTGTNFSSWYTTAGNNESWFAQFISANIKSGDRIVAFDTGLVGASAYRTPLGNAFGQLEIYDGTGDRLFGTIPLTGVNKAATGYSGTTVSGTLNGAAITSRAYDGNMNPSATLGIGSYSGTASGFINGWMQKISYYPQRLTDAELQAITK